MVDNETLLITVIVGIGVFYYFNHRVQSDEEVHHKQDDDRKNMAISNLDILTSRYDALNIEEHEGAAKLSQFAESALTAIVEDVIRLDAEARQIQGMDEGFFEKTGDLIRSGRYHLESHTKHVADEEAHKAHAEVGVCPIENKTEVTTVAVVHNHFDQRRQSVNQVQLLTDARSVVQQQALIDARHTSVQTTHTFQQQNNELKQLNINNPHTESRGPDTLPQGETPQELLTHVTTAEPSGNQSISDQQQNNRDNQTHAKAVMGCGPLTVANRPTVAQVLERTTALSDLSSQASRRSKEIAERAGQMRGAGVIAGSVREVDIFNSAPPLFHDNHDTPPAAVAEPTAKGEGSKPLPGVGDESMFDEGGEAVDKGRKRGPPVQGTQREGSPKKRTKLAPMAPKLKRIPISPLEVRQRAAKVEIGEFNAKIGQELDKLRAARKYDEVVSHSIEALIPKLDRAIHVGGTKGQKENYKRTLRPGYLRRLNEHKTRFSIIPLEIKSRYS